MHTDPEVLALVALGERDAATPEELDHIAHCDACGRDVDELGHLTSVGRTISDHFTLETPSPEVWNRIRAQLGFHDDFSSQLVPPPAGTQLPTDLADPSPTVAGEAPTIDLSNSARRRKRRMLSLALAAALVLLAGVGGALVWQRLSQGGETVVSAVQLNALPDWAGATGEAQLEQDADGKRWLVVTMATPRPVDGLREVWLLKRDATAMVSVGTMGESPDRLPVPDTVDVQEFPVVDVSDEPPDGVPTHSGDSIVRGTLDV